MLDLSYFIGRSFVGDRRRKNECFFLNYNTVILPGCVGLFKDFISTNNNSAPPSLMSLS